MAQYWLDLVRYADSGGYHSDNAREVWMYRDYVIAAFNGNKPFDRFTREQLAGDLLPEPTEETRLASGYNRLLQTTEEGGGQPKEYTAKYAADRVRNVASVWLASTMGCSECHNHKFDPFTTRQFYSLQAFFADVSERAIGHQDETPFPSPEQARQIADFDAQVADVRRRLDTQTPELDAALARWEAEQGNPNINWTTLKPISAVSSAGSKLKILDDGFDPGRGVGRKARRAGCLHPRPVDRQDRPDRPAVGGAVRSQPAGQRARPCGQRQFRPLRAAGGRGAG